ncbi:hypothetical protein DVR12_15910 [Chitinophaga silvatica]|uniref:DUF3108 domain-containing protein n=1 Tax=Chitinophaga silvatica TaxID=2282649 RepID=A0A3E1Y844_9BACT|nr:hypothetical protein [Chitinophaga silvatica]RFS21382.1 hypothetical protein DVR12_15910 [Chitinophaga silvatica]
MKSLVILLLTACSVLSINAQNCKGYYYLTNNAEIEMTIFDSKDNASGKTVYKVTRVRNTGDSTISDFTNNYYDRDAQLLTSGEGHFRCYGSGVVLDMKMSIPSMQQMEDIKIPAKPNKAYLDYPAEMQVGQQLKDGLFEMTGKMNGVDVDVSYSVNNRKVAGQEMVTTPAGTWTCYKIAYDIDFEMRMMGAGIPIQFSAVEWFAPGFGTVKSVSMKDGQLVGATLITSVK